MKIGLAKQKCSAVRDIRCSVLVSGLVSWICLVAWGQEAWAYPASRPTATSQPAAHAAKPTAQSRSSAVMLRVDANGQMWMGQQPMSVPALVKEMGGWKQQGTEVQVSFAAQAPMSRVLVIQTLLREYGVTWKRADASAHSGSSGHAVVPSVRKFHGGAGETKPHTEDHGSKQSKQGSGIRPRSWAKVPMKMQQGLSSATKDVVELRGQLWAHGQFLARTLPTALIRYQGTKRQPLGHLQSNTAGQFRYRWRTEPGATYRISMLANNQLMEFPIPLSQQQTGYLHLRLTIPGEPVPHKGDSPVPAQKDRVMLGHASGMSPGVQDKTKATTQTVVPTTSRPVAAKTTEPERLGPCVWKDVPLGRMAKVPENEGMEMRVRFLFPSSMKQEPLPTGLIRRKGQQRDPVARVKTDAVGCARFWVKVETGVVYEVALLLGAKLSLKPLPAPRPGVKSLETTIALDTQPAQSTFIENLSVIYELVSADRIRAVHVVQLIYQPSPMHQQDEVILPLAAGAQSIKMEQGIPGANWKAEKIGLRLTNTPKPGSYRVLYHYELARQAGTASWHLVSTQQIGQVNLFFGKGLKPGLEAKLQHVQLGKGVDKRDFHVLRLPQMEKGQSLQMPVSGIEPPRRGLLAWIRNMKDEPNGKNKLVGLAVLFSISLLGLFWVFSSPRSPRRNDG